MDNCIKARRTMKKERPKMKMAQITMEFPVEFIKDIKIRAVKHGLFMKQWIRMACLERIGKEDAAK